MHMLLSLQVHELQLMEIFVHIWEVWVQNHTYNVHRQLQYSYFCLFHKFHRIQKYHIQTNQCWWFYVFHWWYKCWWLLFYHSIEIQDLPLKIIQVLTFNLKKNHLLEDTPALPLSGWMTSFIDGPLCIIILIIQKYGNFQVSISLGHFIKHKPLIFEEWFLFTYIFTHIIWWGFPRYSSNSKLFNLL